MTHRSRSAPALRSLYTSLRDFLYPPVCFLCREGLDEPDAVVCPDCWGSFPPAGPGQPAWDELRARLGEDGAVDDIMACWLYEKEGRLHETVHLLKYGRVRSIGLRMGREMGLRIGADPRFASADLLVPVPLHRAKRRARGYNQSELLCEGIAAVTGLAADPSVLERPKHTESQTSLAFALRRQNVGDAFRLGPSGARAAAGRRVILVDDVMTTGATLQACARLLKGARADLVLVSCSAIAR